MERLHKLIGHEHDVDEVARTLYALAGDAQAPAVGAMHVTCADESELECAEAFRHGFAEHLLPRLKFGERSVFRIANLGGRYERGAVHLAEDHYSTLDAEQQFKLLLVKINSHVCVEQTGEGLRFGSMRRYDSRSRYCGALHALLEGLQAPYLEELRVAFASGGRDRVALLLDESKVPPPLRSLFAAVCNARLQAQRAMDDLCRHSPRTPTLGAVIPAVTLNKQAKDTEIVCGIGLVDWRGDEPLVEYRGLGDDPSTLRLRPESGQVRIEEEAVDPLR